MSTARRVTPQWLKNLYHGTAVGVSLHTLVIRRSNRAIRSFVRRRWHGAVPPQDARSALILGQMLLTLDVTKHVLGHYCDQVFRSTPLPPLALTDNVRKSLPDDGCNALDYLRHAVRRGPNYAEAWCELGRVLIEQGDLPGGIAALNEVQYSDSFTDPERQPENVYNIVSSVWVKAWYYIGQAEERLGRPQRALQAYAEALTLEPGAPLVRGAVAEILLSRGQVSRSLSYWLSSLHAMPMIVALPKSERDLTRLPAIMSIHRERIGHVRSPRASMLSGSNG